MAGLTDTARHAARLAMPLVAIIALAVAVRAYADGAGQHVKPYIGTYFRNEIAAMADLPWWSFLLPLKPMNGRWGTTGFLLVHWLETLLGEPNTFYLLTAIMVALGYIFTYLTFRSLSLAVLTGFAFATTTFNYHVYSVPGSVIVLPLVSFLLMFVYFQIQWLRSSDYSGVWATATVIACLLFALAYEGWLDIVPLVWIVYPALAWHFWRTGGHWRSVQCLFLLSLVTVTAVVYIVIKTYT